MCFTKTDLTKGIININDIIIAPGTVLDEHIFVQLSKYYSVKSNQNGLSFSRPFPSFFPDSIIFGIYYNSETYKIEKVEFFINSKTKNNGYEDSFKQALKEKEVILQQYINIPPSVIHNEYIEWVFDWGKIHCGYYLTRDYGYAWDMYIKFNNQKPSP